MIAPHRGKPQGLRPLMQRAPCAPYMVGAAQAAQTPGLTLPGAAAQAARSCIVEAAGPAKW